ncbi:tetratricopeptide repeat protein [Actinokineospora auranticolor]|uniref:P27 family phage terminase small subunit n=1 Tax=Actinokineospora auranticolor TaxID=155976 RepID=UPI001CA556A0|nr:tetratricopeptide repeat protein [Actinokineospora auranticolor]
MLHGDRPDRINTREPVPPDAEVEPPDRLSDSARAIRDRLAPGLVARKVLTVWDADALAILCQAVARYREATSLLNSSALLVQGSGGLVKNPTTTLGTANDLALRLHATGDHRAARDLDEDTLARYRRVLGEDHPDTPRTGRDLVSVLRDLDQHDQADALQTWIDHTATSRRSWTNRRPASTTEPSCSRHHEHPVMPQTVRTTQGRECSSSAETTHGRAAHIARKHQVQRSDLLMFVRNVHLSN